MTIFGRKLIATLVSLTYLGTLDSACASKHSSAPAITKVNPAALTAGSVGQVLSLKGKNFTTGTSFLWNGSPMAVVGATSPSEAGISVPANLMSSPSTVSLVARASNGSMSAAVHLRVVPPLVVAAPGNPLGYVGTAYSDPLSASGGTPTYAWSIAGGSLPSGLMLNPKTGLISGNPTKSGIFNAVVRVTDQGLPAQSKIVTMTLEIDAAKLSIAPVTLPPAEVGITYAAAFKVTGGTPAYTWSVTSGSLPAGLEMSATTGIIAGAPKASGKATFTVSVKDNSQVEQAQSVVASITAVGAPAATNSGNTWFVRSDGGTRYSSNMTQGQCDGKGDLPYGGSGANQHCAFNDVRYLWQDGSYPSGGFPSYGWIGSGGDTYLLRGSIGTGQTNRIGWNNPTSSFDSGSFWGLPGDPFGSGMPVPLSGTAAQHTRILGENFGNCHSQTARTQLHGGFGVYSVLNLSGSSYVDVQCLDITDFSSCGRQAQIHACSSNLGSLDDYASSGVIQSNTTTHLTMIDVRIHGTAGAGLSGPSGDASVYSFVDIIGNASAGWNADNGTRGVGSALVQNFNISWNGCAEEYPIVDALPYQDCTDDNIGGYGDGFGTATLNSTTPWRIVFDQGVVSYNTQDGLDALHLTGAGSSMTITRVLAFGNMGQQMKIGGSSATAMNNLIVTNCNALRQSIPGTPAGYNTRLSDFCRAADTGILLSASDGASMRFDFNTVYSASATALEIVCGAICTNTDLVDYRNNIFIGFLNDTADGYPNGGTGDYANPIYDGPSASTNPGSIFSNNITYHPKSNWQCPAAGETAGICADPLLVDETWHLYDYGDMSPAPGRNLAVGAGVLIPQVTTSYTGQPRPNPPAIGAYE